MRPPTSWSGSGKATSSGTVLTERIEALRELNISAEWLERELRGELPELELGTWPEEPISSTPPPLPEGEDLTLVFLPCAEGAQAPAWLRFGGFNDCPQPAEHVGRFRDWWTRHGAEPIGLGGDWVQLRVERPPVTRNDALALAREQARYCSEGLDHTIAELAAQLMEARSWLFWWD